MAPPTMPNTTYPERREECAEHEKRMDQVDKELHFLNGTIKGMGLIIGILACVLAWIGNNITTKLDTITTMLTFLQVTDQRHDGEIKALQSEMEAVRARHQFWDQKRSERSK